MSFSSVDRGSVNSEKNSKIIAWRGFSSASLTACAIGLTLKGGSDIGDGEVVGVEKPSLNPMNKNLVFDYWG